MLHPTADQMELGNLAEQNKWLFVAGLKPMLREPLLQQLGISATHMAPNSCPSWHKIVTMAQNIEAATTLPVEMARVRTGNPRGQWKRQEKQQTGDVCWRCGGPHVRTKCKFPPSIRCMTCGRGGHMKRSVDNKRG